MKIAAVVFMYLFICLLLLFCPGVFIFFGENGETIPLIRYKVKKKNKQTKITKSTELKSTGASWKLNKR